MTSVNVRLDPQKISPTVGFSTPYILRLCLSIFSRLRVCSWVYGVARSPIALSTTALSTIALSPVAFAVDFIAPTHAIASPTSRSIAQAFPQRRPPSIPVPLPSRTEQFPSATSPGFPALIPTELELLESFAPGPHFGSSAFSSLNPPSGPLQVPDNRIPIGNAGRRSDVSSFTAAQMPWNNNPSRQNVGGGGAQFPVASTLPPASRPPSTLFPQLQTSSTQTSPTQTSPTQTSLSQTYNSQIQKPHFSQSQSLWSQPPRFPAAQPSPLWGQPSVWSQTPQAPIPSPSPWRYRLFIALPPHAAQANRLQAQLRLWVSDAFVTVVRGQRVLQLGNFRDRDRANLMFEQLRRLGFWPQIEVTTQ